jgi:glucosamine--fructose-6-phosphate aminotransferase (isomerizing)
MWKEIIEQPSVIKVCREQNQVKVKKLSEEIKRRSIVFSYIAARGTSDHAAVYGKYILEIVAGIPTGLAASSVFTMYDGSLNLKNTLLIAVSQSGQAADVLEVLRAAKRAGALTVSITNFADSPLAIEADFHLDCSAGLEKSVAATKTFTAEMLLFAMLASELANHDTLPNQILKIPDLISETIKLAEPSLGCVERYRFMNECFVLARGVNFPIALETALKIQETAYVRAKAFAVSDFQHGPIAMIDSDIPVIAIAPTGASFTELENIIGRLEENNIEILVISNSKQLLKGRTNAFETAWTDNDLISPFLNIVVSQMFACRLSTIKGFDPDNPRHLKKVTITR